MNKHRPPNTDSLSRRTLKWLTFLLLPCFTSMLEKIDQSVLYRRVGALMNENGCEFRVWVPNVKSVEVVLEGKNQSRPLKHEGFGYWYGKFDDIEEGERYKFKIKKGLERPDPASFSQPDGVHEASEVIRLDNFKWEDGNWQGIPSGRMIIYELHTGTFTPEGTFRGIEQKLDHLVKLGVNTIEIMPVAQFPGTRNWGYDGVYPFAVQNSYGGVYGLQHLVNECHKKGIAVILDVVYNHLGPEGNYLYDYGAYFTGKYHTPWGKAINFDDRFSYGVRNFFLQNALMWLRDFQVDGLRLDAVHAIIDESAEHFLRELAMEVDGLETATGRKYTLIAESDLNDAKVINPLDQGGYGLNMQWADDMHHAIHSLVTGERSGYYQDFGTASHFGKACRNGFVYDGIYSSFRKRIIGSATSGNDASQFVVCIQNHDQTGNRMLGDRLTHLVSFEALKVSAAAYILSPYTPMLFMGEEYAETNSFLYFISHTDPGLVKAVQKGRKQEFKSFNWSEEPPDPQSEATFKKSKLQWDLLQNSPHCQAMFNFYRELLHLKSEHPVLSERNRENMEITTDDDKEVVRLIRWNNHNQRVAIWLNFSDRSQQMDCEKDWGPLKKVLNSADEKWAGPGDDLPIEISLAGKFVLPVQGAVVFEF